ILPPLCLIAGPGLRHVLSRKGALRTAVLATAAVWICVAQVAAVSWFRLKPVLEAEAKAGAAVGDYIRQHSDENARVYVWGYSSPSYYYWIRRIMATRFAFNNYLTGRIWGTRLNDVPNAVTDAFVVPEAWHEALSDLERAPPQFIVDAASGATHLGM